MSYCTLQDIRNILPKNVTIGDYTTPTVSSAKGNTISTSVANSFIYYATQYIDSRISQLYYCPLVKIKKVTVNLLANMLPSSTDVIVDDISGFYPGGSVYLKDDNGSENSVVASISETIVEGGNTVRNFNHLTLSSPTVKAYDAGSNGVVSLIIYPDPIPVMTARLACALMFDKIFVADQEPDISNYGKTLRNLVVIDMNAILSGQIRLYGQELCSRRFVRGQLFDAVKLAIENITIDQGKE